MLFFKDHPLQKNPLFPLRWRLVGGGRGSRNRKLCTKVKWGSTRQGSRRKSAFLPLPTPHRRWRLRLTADIPRMGSNHGRPSEGIKVAGIPYDERHQRSAIEDGYPAPSSMLLRAALLGTAFSLIILMRTLWRMLKVCIK